MIWHETIRERLSNRENILPIQAQEEFIIPVFFEKIFPVISAIVDVEVLSKFQLKHGYFRVSASALTAASSTATISSKETVQ